MNIIMNFLCSLPDYESSVQGGSDYVYVKLTGSNVSKLIESVYLTKNAFMEQVSRVPEGMGS